MGKLQIIFIHDLTNSKFDYFFKGRDIRPNSEGLRMLSVEFNMIHSNKIVRPLKARAYLLKRQDEFVRISSPLTSFVSML